MSIVVATAHCPAVGVKVYVYNPAEAVVIIGGAHVPVMELLEEVGNEGTMPPKQILEEVPKLNVGVVCGVIIV
jgi:hypothetical protein